MMVGRCKDLLVLQTLKTSLVSNFPSSLKLPPDFPGSPVVKTAFSMQGAMVQFLIGELRSHMPRGMAKIEKDNLI